ncbi:caspase domain-containing protein [Bradyrhizobium sp. ARR65]|uniref:caspase family protein n=1 Tax=Bradyrhizobium sp. ARR65 TaxID=1040989 RepID=UPI00046608CC|nr:caspase domain-containing protein [Bradyrhizobium sp. ARR65]
MKPARTFPLVSLCLVLIAALSAWGSPASAQQQEKRIALVVGNSAYAKAPLATAANDAGLIAQTLQAAGFDVIGARDLDGDTLRKSLRDFIQKAESSGQDTVAMVYLAGYGVQLAGENYFIPVDSTINRDTDIPTEGLRISDYTRQLAALPLKAGVVVLDAARQQPFIEGGQQIASGLALVEPDNNMLIAFNAAPGTVAPSEQGPYGSYAQSLAEMIRTGGLSLPDVFDRVRLRVNEASKGAQVPWDAQKIQAQFSFFDRAPDAPPVQGPADQVAAIRDRPIRDLSVQDAYTAALERDTLQGYEDFVLAFPNDPLAKRVRAIIAARREAITWRRTYRTDTPEAYWSYLRRYPHGPHAYDARRRLAILTAPLEPPSSFAMIDYDVPPPPPDEIVYVDRPVLYFGDPDFGFVPPPPPPVFFLPPPPPDFVVLPPPIAPVGLFILPQPRFVPIPVFVRPPVYVAPPPNNIIFNNIHNTTVINNVINQPPPASAAAAPGAPQAAAAAASAAPVGASPPVPPSVRHQATLIQQGKAPVPPSATFAPASKLSTPAAAPANMHPSASPPQSTLPKANELPVPGKGAPPAPAASGPAAAVSPSAKLAPAAPPATGAPPAGVHPNARLAPSPTQPGAAPGKPGPASPPSANVARSKPAVESLQRRGAPPPPPAAPRPTARLSTPPTPPRPAPQHAAPPAPSRPSPPVSARVTPPPPPPVHHVAPPPPAAVHAPPPAVHAPPPPVARAPSPPPIAHAAPPPRPVAPPRPPAAAPKKCPPNQPKC